MEPVQDDQHLAKTLSVGQAIGLGITIVVGSGLLVLPGLAYREVGDAAIWAWVGDALLVLPMLVVFGYLGSRYPSAGGIAGFVQTGFGRTGAAATEVLLIGTFCLGIPAIAITGGNYVAAAVGGSETVAAASALALLALGGAVNWLGASVSGRLQQVLAVVLVVLVTGGAAAALLAAPVVNPQVAELSDWELAIPALGIVFFAYTGWEMLSFTAEEYRNPRRDFPLAIAGSFVAVVGMYLLIALGVQRSLDAEDPETVTAPVAALLTATFGSVTGRVVGVLGGIIIAANVVGAVWAASRLFFSSAREGLLPPRLARVDPASRAPRAAIATALTVMSLVWLAHTLGLVSLSLILRLPGQNFLVLYGLSVAAYVVLVGGTVQRLLGILAGLLVLVTAATFGPGLLYSAALMLVGGLLSRLRVARRARSAAR